MKEFIYQYKLPIIFGGLGLILAILLVSIGFFKTLLLVVLTVLGTMIGFYLEQSGLFRDIFKPRNK
ncbi:DUF2273 domain-containing protein [Enterococcus xiangfangensis]|uniref:DUF2273 domain-containing protein n=1 Tax=Enterococcus xiangfangensis TaxID=1296537 RepID=A0ABU3FB49_9ENTE|nr:DUF2273 domain-containing protein [Enterococcus xiangfangensis]MBM7712374.1 putative membrane protein [Enterococcus xiangfangensis]MDT2759878.1 DUF2273 domain-containing protein [Enterococcus xiangfangensis]NBK08948.1 DUF2273 domain-containing protein [Enterococcus asini]